MVPLSLTMQIVALACIVFIPFLITTALCLQEIFPQPVLRNPSFEDYCTNGTGFFFAPDPSPYLSSGLNNISASNAPTLIEWNVSGQGLQVVYGGASDGNCYFSPFWAREGGGVNQILSTAPNASYLVRFDMMIYAVVCGDSFPGIISIQVSAGTQNASKFFGSAIGPWSSSTFQFQASSYQTELSMSGSEGSCGIGIDNVRVELVRDPSSNVLSNGGFELASGIPPDPGSAGYELQAGSQALSSWVVTGSGLTCFGASVFPPSEGRRLLWLTTQTSLTQEPGGLMQTLPTIANVTYQVSFDVACQCNFNGTTTMVPSCQLEVDVGASLLNFTLLSQNHTAANPGWSRRVAEFTATSNQTVMAFQDGAPSRRIYDVAYYQCGPYLDNVVVSIPAQQALLRLRVGLGSPGSLMSWNELSDPCLISPYSSASWAGVTCMGMEVVGLDLSGLGLSEEIPFELFALSSSLTSLNLSNNLISGSIPSFLGGMKKLATLDLSNNKLQGVIPAELGNLLLQKLELQGNKLEGVIPNTLALPTLKLLNLQGNNLSGPVPQGISLQRDNGTVLTFSPGNDNLCSENARDLLKSCNPPPMPNPPSSKGVSTWLSAFGGGIAAVVLVGVLVFMFLKMRRSKRSSGGQEKIDLKLATCQAFSLQELEEATKGFAVVLGKGGYGTVCKAELKDGRVAAVKRLNHVSRQGPQEFISEVELLSRLHHANLVSLLGYCIEYREHILVYEFMAKGSLYDILHKPAFRQRIPWEDRMKIAMHIAFGIEYLHYFASPGLVHRDIKSSNILLDEKNNAKVADFGLCKESLLGADEAQTTAIKGSFGYLDPAYVKTNKLSSKSDVFSFGVILLELITGRRPVMEGELLTDWCKQFYDLDVSLMLDPALARHYVENELMMMASVARDCVIEEREFRPNMRSVVHRLCAGLPLGGLPSPTSSEERLLFSDSQDEEEIDADSSVLLPR